VNLDDSFDFRGEEAIVIFIVFNLLCNALFYTAASTLPITITADASQKTLAVKDHGPGIIRTEICHGMIDVSESPMSFKTTDLYDDYAARARVQCH